jgi:anthranilate/para-aminobenzoate synthase component I
VVSAAASAPVAPPASSRAASPSLPDERTAPSFLFESVENGSAVGRHSILAARPRVELTAREQQVTVVDHRRQTRRTAESGDPLAVLRELAAPMRTGDYGRYLLALAERGVGR